jgi:filamentous hemagglutinin family protein
MTTKAAKNVFESQEEDRQRARQIRKEYRRRKLSEVTVAVLSCLQVTQTLAQTTTIVDANAVVVTPTGPIVGAYTFSGSTGIVDLNLNRRAVVVWDQLGMLSSETLRFTNGAASIDGASSLVLNKITGGGSSTMSGTIQAPNDIGLIFVNPNGFTITGAFNAPASSRLLFTTKEINANGTASTAAITSLANTLEAGNVAGALLPVNRDAYLGQGSTNFLPTSNGGIVISGSNANTDVQSFIVGGTDTVHNPTGKIKGSLIFITTDAGDITKAGSGSVGSGGEVYAKSTSGNITLGGEDTSQIFVDTGGNVTISQTTTSLTLGNVTGGNVAISSTFEISQISGAKVTSNGSVSFALGDASALGQIAGPITLQTNNASLSVTPLAGVGSPSSVFINFDGSLRMGNVTTSGDLKVAGTNAGNTLQQTGTLTLSGTNPTLNFGKAAVTDLNYSRSTGGTITLTGQTANSSLAFLSTGGFSNVNGGVIIDSAGTIQRSSGNVAIAAGTLELKGGVSTNGTLVTSLGNLTATSTGALLISNNQSLNLSAPNISGGPSNISVSTGNLTLTGNVAGSGDLTLDAANTVALASQTVTRTTGNLTITGGNVTATSFELSAANGSINVTSTGDLAVTKGNVTSSTGTTFRSTGGNLTAATTGNLAATGSLNLTTSAAGNIATTNNITVTGGNLTLTSNGALTIGQNVSATNIFVNSVDAANTITIGAVGDLTIGAASFANLLATNGVVVGAAGQTGNLTVNAATTANSNVTLNGGNVSIGSDLSLSGGKNLTVVANNGTISATGNLAVAALSLTSNNNGSATLSGANNLITGKYQNQEANIILPRV